MSRIPMFCIWAFVSVMSAMLIIHLLCLGASIRDKEYVKNGIIVVKKADGKWLYFTDNDGVEHKRLWKP